MGFFDSVKKKKKEEGLTSESIYPGNSTFDMPAPPVEGSEAGGLDGLDFMPEQSAKEDMVIAHPSLDESKPTLPDAPQPGMANLPKDWQDFAKVNDRSSERQRMPASVRQDIQASTIPNTRQLKIEQDAQAEDDMLKYADGNYPANNDAEGRDDASQKVMASAGYEDEQARPIRQSATPLRDMPPAETHMVDRVKRQDMEDIQKARPAKAGLKFENKGPLFVEMDAYSAIIDEIALSSERLREMDMTLVRIESLREKEGLELRKWHQSFEDIRKKLMYIDDALFEPKIR
jgi:hypothetical protein